MDVALAQLGIFVHIEHVMLDMIKNTCIIYGNSNVRLINRSHKLRFFGLKTQLRTQEESGLVAFCISRANGSAKTRISANRLKPCIDEPLNEPRRSSVNQATRKTGKMGYREFGLLYSRLIIELINYVDSRLMLAIPRSNPSRGSLCLKDL